jgi:hypothetical protein
MVLRGVKLLGDDLTDQYKRRRQSKKGVLAIAVCCVVQYDLTLLNRTKGLVTTAADACDFCITWCQQVKEKLQQAPRSAIWMERL